MVRVKATNASKVYNKAIKELHRIAVEGEEFEISEERFKFLNGANNYKIKFVELANPKPAKMDTATIKEEPVEEPVIQEVAKVEIPEVDANVEPEIYVIEPNKAPVQVDENLAPIEDVEISKVLPNTSVEPFEEKPKKKRSRKKTAK